MILHSVATRLQRHPLLWACLCALLMVMWAGCSPEKHYDVLRYFFDDPPRPAAPVAASSTRPSEGSPTTRQTSDQIVAGKYRHAPYVQNKCTACHADVNAERVSALRADTCRDCHARVPTEHPWPHTAVVEESCLWCHAPHESNTASLLRTPAPQLCLQCHDGRRLSPTVEQHKAEGVDCLSCHSAHGGRDRRLLKDRSAGIAAPTTQLAAQE